MGREGTQKGGLVIETYDDVEKVFTEKEYMIANRHGWYDALRALSSSPAFNETHKEAFQAMGFPVLRELEELGAGPPGGRENEVNKEYYQWLDAQHTPGAQE